MNTYLQTQRYIELWINVYVWSPIHHAVGELCMGCPRAVHGLSADCPWEVRGLPIGCPRTTVHRVGCPRAIFPGRFIKKKGHGLPADCPWLPSVGCLRAIHGLSMICPWAASGLSVGCPWAVRGLSVGGPRAILSLAIHQKYYYCRWAACGPFVDGHPSAVRRLLTSRPPAVT